MTYSIESKLSTLKDLLALKMQEAGNLSDYITAYIIPQVFEKAEIDEYSAQLKDRVFHIVQAALNAECK
jgi:predicted metal-dependent peptidase